MTQRLTSWHVTCSVILKIYGETSSRLMFSLEKRVFVALSRSRLNVRGDVEDTDIE